MLKCFKISGLLITFFLLQGFQLGENLFLLEGTLNCDSGAVKINRGPSAVGSQKDLPSLSAARDRLLRAGYSKAGVTKLSEILTAACKEEFASESGLAVTPERDQSVPGLEQPLRQAKTTNIKSSPGSLVLLQKRNQILIFKVFRDTSGVVEYNASGHPTNSAAAQRVAGYVMEKGEADCKPISNVCVKCSDGKIICSTPALR